MVVVCGRWREGGSERRAYEMGNLRTDKVQWWQMVLDLLEFQDDALLLVEFAFSVTFYPNFRHPAIQSINLNNQLVQIYVQICYNAMRMHIYSSVCSCALYDLHMMPCHAKCQVCRGLPIIGV